MTTDNRKSSVAVVLWIAFLLSTATQVAGSQGANATPIARAIAFVSMLAQGNFDGAEADFTDQMKQAAPPEKLREVWAGLQSQAGAFQNTADTSMAVKDGYTTVVVRTNFKLQAVGIELAFDSAGKIAGMHLVPPP